MLAALVAIAGIITPLGLHEEFQPGKTKVARFEYVHDPSAFGAGTTARFNNAGFARICEFDDSTILSAYAPCPYTNNTVHLVQDELGDHIGFNKSWEIAIARELQDIFGSGSRNYLTTVSSFFDIQWRQMTTAQIQNVSDNKDFPVGKYRQMDTLISDDKIKLVDGLVVDASSGGIGFRNHTIPVGVGIGAVWTEELLFIQPETQCVDLNLTMDYENPKSGDQTNPLQPQVTVQLTDRGGFANSGHFRPDYDHDNAQKNPDLRQRAYQAAWANNAYSLMYFGGSHPVQNLTGPVDPSQLNPINSTIGKQYEIVFQQLKQPINTFQTYSDYGAYIFQIDDDHRYPNPNRIQLENFTNLGKSTIL
jgi:hypothetical protein